MKKSGYLIKPASALCNLKCRYCFYNDLVKDTPSTHFSIMDEKVVDAIIEKTLGEDKELEVSYLFQGGEPTLAGQSFFNDCFKKRDEKKSKNQIVNYAIQTNGTTINEQWVRIFKENDFLVGVSIDGYQENHDHSRIDKNDHPTFDAIIKNIELLRKHKVPFNVLTVLTKKLSKSPEKLYRFYKDYKIEHVQIIPCLPILEEKVLDDELSPHDYSSFYKVFFDLWYMDFMLGSYMSVNLFENIIPMFKNIPPRQCGMLGYCSFQHVIEFDGSVYPCDFYVLEKNRSGNILTDEIQSIRKSSAAVNFLGERKELRPICKACKFKTMCYGNCKRESVVLFNDEFCGYQDFLEYSIPRFRGIASNWQVDFTNEKK